VGTESRLVSVKGNVAGILREEIILGRIKPGERVVEGKWAAKLKVAQASVREALNILAAEGFVQKSLGRSARVIEMTTEDVIQIYEVRTYLERLAARLVAIRRPDLSDLHQLVADIQSSVSSGNLRGFCDRSLAFHLLICEKSGNQILLQQLRHLIVPLFAFILLRQHASMADRERWWKSLDDHKLILEAIESGDPEIAERRVAEMIQSFAERTISLLENETGAAAGTASSSDSRRIVSLV
jgi:DNA-binding GntR family transcriptional regulator